MGKVLDMVIKFVSILSVNGLQQSDRKDSDTITRGASKKNR